MTGKLLELIGKKHLIKPIDTGDLETIRANGMVFKVEAYRAEGLGHVSIMRAKGFFGLMRMDTLIIDPFERDLPLYSYDRIYAMGNDTLIVELYDTLLGAYSESAALAVKDKYSELPERDPGEHWYDPIKLSSSISKKGKRISDRLDAMTLEHFSAYLSSSATPITDIAAKKKKAAVYVNGLLEKGGPSTDVFKKRLGIEQTSRLFCELLFGIS